MQKKILTLKRLLGIREVLLLLVILVISGLVSIFTPYFFVPVNLESMLMSMTVEGLIVIGMMMLLISGGLDLSVGSAMAFTGVISAMLSKSGIPILLVIVLSLLCATLIGLANGLLIAKFSLNPFITTLGMMMAVRGLMLIIANGKAVLNLPEGFLNVGQGRLLGIQYPIIVFVVLTIIADLLMRNSRFMRQGYYVGNNVQSAELNGINVAVVQVVNYCIAACLSGLAGIMLTARFGSASVTMGENTALKVITAAIIGGASLNGGEGTVLGGVLGALFMQIISTSLNLLGVDIYWQTFITGFILILAILGDAINEHNKQKNIQLARG